ncbi:antigen 5 like allergen Cul n 1 [Drosophila madeirensis]|uniref:Venom allergen-1 n=1 Tax=Drosophila madeirensis TaxID=30013 RepID=A0AAU9FZ40_DROMD
MKFAPFALLALAVGVAQATDYCSWDICNGGSHIACGHSNWWSSNCPSNVQEIIMDDYHKWVLVQSHNEKRNYIAGGNDRNHNAACRMATMQWDNELAYLALLNVAQCDMNHDGCHNTDNFKYSGQNLAWMAFSGDLPNSATVLANSVQMWYDEVTNSNSGIIEYGYPSGYTGPAIGHFTVMVAERNTRVGCAAATYTRDGWNQVLVACNYATTNMIGRQIYSSCARGGQLCGSGTNRDFPNLCSYNEWYDVTSW